MELEIRELRKKDHKKAIGYAVKGMNFNDYLESRLGLWLYGRYFWDLELTNATQVIAAYMGDELAGVLLADIKGEKKAYRSFGKTLYVRFVNLIQRIFFKEGVGPYDKANSEMLAEYKRHNSPDGEIRFLAADPHIKAKGIGTLLLGALEKREKGRQIYLFTDDRCTYQFYEHRGFDRVGERDIEMEMNGRIVPLKCLLYSKKIM